MLSPVSEKETVKTIDPAFPPPPFLPLPPSEAGDGIRGMAIPYFHR
jgi:hypothetical protein